MDKMNINAVADYVIVRLSEAGAGLNLLKLQKLMYYIQAWHIATKGESLFNGKFQAWVHGPVSRELYDRFSRTHMMYDAITMRDIDQSESSVKLSESAVLHINEVLDAYGAYSGPQLEKMTHDEEPWIVARGELSSTARCETEIDEDLMGVFYKKALENAGE